MAKYTDNIDERGNTLADALEEYPSVDDWAWDTPIALATSAAADDIIDTGAAHGFGAGEVVQFPTLTGGAGLTAETIYYVIAANLAAQTFQVSETPGGSAKLFTTDITAGTVATLKPASELEDVEGSNVMLPAQSDAEVDAQQ